MKMKKYLIAGGNSTLIVWDCPQSQKTTIIDQYLGEVEQIGFASVDRQGVPTFTMMGNELSGNGTLAFASTLGEKGKLSTSGVSEPVLYKNTQDVSSVMIPILCRRDGDCILLEGIGYLCVDREIENKKEKLEILAKQYELPAFGLAICKGDALIPFVYVAETKSLFRESACGSGSIATSVFTGQEKIQQPTGEYIEIQKTNQGFWISAKVQEIVLSDTQIESQVE